MARKKDLELSPLMIYTCQQVLIMDHVNMVEVEVGIGIGVGSGGCSPSNRQSTASTAYAPTASDTHM